MSTTQAPNEQFIIVHHIPIPGNLHHCISENSMVFTSWKCAQCIIPWYFPITAEHDPTYCNIAHRTKDSVSFIILLSKECVRIQQASVLGRDRAGAATAGTFSNMRRQNPITHLHGDPGGSLRHTARRADPFATRHGERPHRRHPASRLDFSLFFCPTSPGASRKTTGIRRVSGRYVAAARTPWQRCQIIHPVGLELCNYQRGKSRCSCCDWAHHEWQNAGLTRHGGHEAKCRAFKRPVLHHTYLRLKAAWRCLGWFTLHEHWEGL